MKKKKFKLLIISHCFPHNKDEVSGNFIYDFCLALKQNKELEITVFTPKMKVSYDFDYMKKAVTEIFLFDWKGGEKRLSELKVSKFKDLISLVSIFRDGKKEFLKYIKDNDFNFVLIPWLIPNGYYAYKMLGKKQIPYATWALGSDINVYGSYPIVKKIIKNILAKAAFSLVNSKAMNQKILEKYHKKSIMLNTNRKIPVSDLQYKQKKNYLKLVIVARLEKVKGVDILINALRLTNNSKIFIDIIGDGSQRENLEYLAREYKLSRQIKFHGFKNAKEISDLVTVADYLVISSRSEGMPVAFFEAMSLSVPVLATDVGDIKFYCDQYNVGRTVSTSEQELAYLIGYCFHFPIMRNILSENTKLLKDKYSIEYSAQKFFEMIKKY